MSLPTNALASSGFKGDIIEPSNDTQFTAATQTWGDQGQSSPKLALRPKSAEDVSIALSWLSANDIPFAVRSGGLGESPSDGVIIDMGYFDKVHYDSTTNLVHLGPGQTWHKVYSKLSSLPVTVLGGRVGYVGVGGFTLGGGLSYLANMYGVAADSIVDAQVVLAGGGIVNAKDDEELLFALKGAGHAFGVVTELIVKAYPKPPTVYGGVLLFPMDKFDALASHLITISDPKVNAMLGVARMPPDMHPAILLVVMVFDEESYAKETLKWAWDLEPLMDWTKKMSLEESIKTQEMYIHPPAKGTIFQQHNLVLSKLTPEIMKAGLEWQAEIQKDPRFYGASLLFEPFRPGAFSPTSSSNKKDEDERSAWPHSSYNTYIINIIIEQRNFSPEHIQENNAHLRECVRRMEEKAESGTILPRYPNYYLAGVPVEEYYAGNLGKLRKVKARVDPQGVFKSGIRIQ